MSLFKIILVAYFVIAVIVILLSHQPGENYLDAVIRGLIWPYSVVLAVKA